MPDHITAAHSPNPDLAPLTLSAAALELAQELESDKHGKTGVLSLDNAGLGTLQRPIADLPGVNTDNGLSPREIAKQLDRSDEPNIRDALDRMQARGVVELVPGATFKRYRLTEPYR